MVKHVYTPEHKVFIEENVKGRTSNELTQLLNEHFGLNLKVNQIRAYMKNHGLTNGVNTQFNKNQKPWNKGMKGLQIGGVETQFKPGMEAHNYVPVGTERVGAEGYILIKVSNEGPWNKRWKLKHKTMWEKANGPIPKGHCLIFLDGNKKNVTYDNLQLISRGQLARLNQNKLISSDPELTKTGIIIADIYGKIGQRKRGK
jgi:hypothetical protein